MVIMPSIGKVTELQIEISPVNLVIILLVVFTIMVFIYTIKIPLYLKIIPLQVIRP